MNRIAFSVDLDDWYHTPLVAGANFSHYKTVNDFFASWKERYDYVTEPSYRLLDLLDELQIKGTFFVIADMVERYPELMDRLADSGHEIAHHSLHHTIPFNTKTKEIVQSQQEWEAEFIEAKNILETRFGNDIVGFRAPGAYFADWMVPILIKHGMLYDSSIVSNSIYNKSNRSLDDFPKTPFVLGENFEALDHMEVGKSLFEIPWVGRKVGKYYLPGGGAFFFRLFGANYFKKMYDHHLKQGDGVFYIHSLDLSNEDFPLSNFRNRPFYWVNKGDKTLKSLRKLLTSFDGQFCPCRELMP